MRPAQLACVRLLDLPQEVAYRRGWLQAAAPGALCAGRDIVWACARAAACGVAAGMGVSQAQGLCPPLTVVAVPAAALLAAQGASAAALRALSPHVECDRSTPGLCWLDAGGMEALFGDAGAWGARVLAQLAAAGHRAAVAVGHRRLFLSALTAAGPPLWVARRAGDEAAHAAALPLAALPASAALRARLAELGVVRLGDFLRLPASACGQVLGAEAAELHRQGLSAAAPTLRPQAQTLPVRQTVCFEPVVDDLHCLVFSIMPALREGLRQVAAKYLRASGLLLSLREEDGAEHLQVLRPAAASCVPESWLELLRLRLEGLRWRRPLAEVTLVWSAQAAPPQQLPLWRQPRRDPHALALAMARLRALMGDEAVAQVELCDSHLPQHRYRYRPYPSPMGGPDAAAGAMSSARAAHASATAARPAAALAFGASAQARPPPPQQGELVLAARPGVGPGPGLVAAPPQAAGLIRQRFAQPRPLPIAHVRRLQAYLRELAAGRRGEALAWGPYRCDAHWWQDEGGEHHDDCYLAVPAGGGEALLWACYDRRHKEWAHYGWVR